MNNGENQRSNKSNLLIVRGSAWLPARRYYAVRYVVVQETLRYHVATADENMPLR